MRSKGKRKAINKVPKKGFLNIASDRAIQIIIAITRKGVSLKKHKEIIATTIIEIKESVIVFKSIFFIIRLLFPERIRLGWRVEGFNIVKILSFDRLRK